MDFVEKIFQIGELERGPIHSKNSKSKLKFLFVSDNPIFGY